MTTPSTTPNDDAALTSDWGRVAADGTVSVRDGEEWRVVGQFPDGDAAEALAYFQRKYSDLVGEVVLLEARYRGGGASASDLRGTAKALRDKIVGAGAVGNLAALTARIDALDGSLAAATETEAAAAREASEASLRARAEIVERAEALAARDPQRVQWKQATAELNDLFTAWQNEQQNGPRVPRGASQDLWKRFREARATVERHRRTFFAEQDEAQRVVRDAKNRLIERAEALAPRGEDGIAAYRDLLAEWKNAGRAGRKLDDALWTRFKAAGDALYGARSERESVEAEESKERIEQRRALLEEARTIPDEAKTADARARLTAIQRRWDEVGRIFPRDKERALDDELRRIENAVKDREQVEWKQNDPRTRDRADDMTRQLTDAIEKLERELADAEASSNAKAAAEARSALEARRGWLRALGG